MVSDVGNGLRIQALSCTVFGVQISATFVKYNLDLFTGVEKENLLPLLDGGSLACCRETRKGHMWPEEQSVTFQPHPDK